MQSISQELHDDAGQQLTVINFQLENLKLDFPDLALTTNPLSESISNLSNSLRNISHLLSNSFVSKNDLYVTIKAELDRLNKQSKIDISYKIVANSKKQFSDTEKIMLFRIFQETINNSLKHAKAKKISVEIFENPIFKLQITDDGKGFDTYKSESKKSIGISNMKTRAKLIRFDLRKAIHLSIISLLISITFANEIKASDWELMFL